MLKLNDEQEALVRKLIRVSTRLAKDIHTNCDNPGECIDASECLLVIEKLENTLGLIEDRPAEGNNLLNHKLF